MTNNNELATIETQLRLIAKKWYASGTTMKNLKGFDITYNESASGRNGVYIGYMGYLEFVPKLTLRKAAGFQRSMWALYFGKSSKYLK